MSTGQPQLVFHDIPGMPGEGLIFLEGPRKHGLWEPNENALRTPVEYSDEDYIEVDENGDPLLEPIPTGINEWKFTPGYHGRFEKLGKPFLYVVSALDPELVCKMRTNPASYYTSPSPGVEPELCLKPFEHPEHLVEHFMFEHAPDQIHGINEENSKLVPEGEDVWICPWDDCMERMPWNDLLDHLRRHMPTRILCTLCGNVFTKEGEAQEHLLPSGEGGDSLAGQSWCAITREKHPEYLVTMLVMYGFLDEAKKVCEEGVGAAILMHLE